MGYYYEPEPAPQYYTRPPPRSHQPRSSRRYTIEVEAPRPVSPSPTRVIVVEKRRREESVGFWPWLCGTFCCCLACCQCADECSGTCCPRTYDDSDSD